MATNIEMPKLSDTMSEGTLIKWHKQVGDSVEIGDIVADVETDKANMEMEAFDEGTITEIRVQEGEKAAIGEVLAVLDGEGGDSGAKGEEKQPEKTDESADSKETSKKSDNGGEKGDAEDGDDKSESAEKSGQAPAPSGTKSEDGGRLKSSPLARKIAEEKGVDLREVEGTGPGGRIVRADVEKAASGGGKKKASSQAKAAEGLAQAAKQRTSTPPSAPEPMQPQAKEGDTTVELSSMRKIIAERLLLSKQTIPHFYLHAEIDVEPLMTLRKQINAQADQTHGNKYSLNDFILKATINAARAVPAVNASFAGDSIVEFAHVGMSVAIAVDDGLVTPVIKQAETKSLLQISKEVKDLAVRARDKKLKPNEFDGGTITVSNLGAWGVENFDAIINPPQALIVSVGAAIQKPVVKDGAIVPGTRMNLGVSCDHRVVDGAVGAQFLAELKKLLEQPALMLI
jgi:pyruvate dehydrogenase E2 component (dihydrolipoamide acetyltransferase)